MATRCMAPGCKELLRPRMWAAHLPPEAHAVYLEHQVRDTAQEIGRVGLSTVVQLLVLSTDGYRHHSGHHARL
jgi:hypothetical protein